MGVTSKLSVSVAATAAFWLLFGYRYFVNAGIETVPIIKRALDPMYMGNDYYLQFITEGYNHRLVYTEVVAFVSALFGSVESAICILYVVFMFATFWGLTSLVSRWTLNTVSIFWVLVGASILWFALVTRMAPGNIGMIYSELTPNAISRCFLIWALVLMIERQPAVAGVFTVAAVAFQPLDAILSLPILLLIGVGLERDRFDRRTVFTLLVITTTTISVALATNWNALAGSGDRDTFVELATGRLGHHYAPSTWAWTSWLVLAGLSGVGSYALALLEEKRLIGICLLTLTAFGLYLAVLGLTGHVALYKLQGSKLMWGPYTIWGLAIMVAVLERSPGRILKTRCAVVYVPVTVVICAGFGYWVTGKEILPTSIDSRLSFTINALSKGNYRTAANYASETENALGAWLAENTAPDVVVLHDPSLQMIRPLAERSSVVQRKLVGFSTDAIHAWLERMDATTDFCAISYDTLLSVARRYKADLIAVSMECTGAHGIERSFRIGDMWVVYEVRL